MLLKLIACNVFQREACWCIAQSPHIIDVEFTELGEHAHSGLLRQRIQDRIDAADKAGKSYDAVLLLFGLCGNATVGLCARRTKLVIPRAHDCCTVLLGSRAKFQEHFQDAPSTPFSSAGYIERGEYFLRVDNGVPTVHYGDGYAALVAQYGEDNARYIWESMRPPALGKTQSYAVFIDVPETTQPAHLARFEQEARASGKTPVRLPGNIRLIRNLLFGEWPPDEFLIVPPGHRIGGVYDWTEIVRAEPPP